MPLIALQVRGVDALRAFSQNLVVPYAPSLETQPAENSREAALVAEVASLKKEVAELETRLAAFG